MTDRVTAIKPILPASDGAARPKVMRRPAHFSAAAPSTVVQPVMSHEMPPREASNPMRRTWQDDGKFAVTLLLIIIATNLAVMAWLNHISGKAKTMATTATAPVAITPAPSRDVTVYAPADTTADRSIAHIDLSTTPEEVPNGTPAHVLDEKAADE